MECDPVPAHSPTLSCQQGKPPKTASLGVQKQQGQPPAVTDRHPCGCLAWMGATSPMQGSADSSNFTLIFAHCEQLVQWEGSDWEVPALLWLLQPHKCISSIPALCGDISECSRVGEVGKVKDIPVLFSDRTQHDPNHSSGQWDGSFALLVLPSAGTRSPWAHGSSEEASYSMPKQCCSQE